MCGEGFVFMCEYVFGGVLVCRYSQMYVFACMLARALVHVYICVECAYVYVYMCMWGATTAAKGEPLYVCTPSHPKPLVTERAREGQRRENRQTESTVQQCGRG